MYGIHSLVDMTDWRQRCPQFSTSPWIRTLCNVTYSSSYHELETVSSSPGSKLALWFTFECGGSEGVLALGWGLQRLWLLLPAPLGSCCHCVNRPVITCWKMADLWLSRYSNHCQQLDNLPDMWVRLSKTSHSLITSRWHREVIETSKV